MKDESKHANWAEWAINHRQLVYFFAVLVLIMGIFSFKSLGRSEDPNFAVKQMVVSAAWPGASAKEVEMHLTNELEKQIQNLPQIDKITSYSRPGVCVITVSLKDEVTGNTVRQGWSCVTLSTTARRTSPAAYSAPIIMTALMMYTAIFMR